MASLREFVKTAATVLPEIPKPERKPSLNERFIWTGLALIVYLVMSITPLYQFGAGKQDPFQFLRIIFASTQGTLMELGIGPIVTSGLILQLLQGSEIIKLDMGNPEDRSLFGSATKLLTFFVIAAESGAYIVGGALGSLAPTQGVVIFVQLFLASVVVLLLDELIQKGWGIGSGVSLFILAGVAQTVMWYTLSPFPVNTGTSTSPGPAEIFGFIPALISSAFAGNLGEIVVRGFKFPSLLTFVLTLVMILVLIYIEGIRVELPITSIKYRGFQGVYPIKLLYVSNIPVILVSALGANIAFFSKLLYGNLGAFANFPYLKYLAQYDSQGNAVGGLVYYISPPRGLDHTLGDPIHSVVYVLYLVTLAVLFARIWVEIGGLNPKAVAKNLMGADVQVPGFRRSGLSIEQVLNRYIPPITIIGGIIIGLIASVSDLFGVFGSGIGILLMVDIVLQYYQMLVKEQIEEVSPRLAGILGQA